MGNYSHWKIESELSFEEKEEVLKELNCVIEYFFINSDGDLRANALKWYEMKSEMQAITKKYPNSTFTVWKIGEEPFVDSWQTIFKNGKILSDKKCKLAPIET